VTVDEEENRSYISNIETAYFTAKARLNQDAVSPLNAICRNKNHVNMNYTYYLLIDSI